MADAEVLAEILEAGQDGLIVKRTILPSGLRIITETIPSFRSAAIGLWVATGSRDERSDEFGAAHYLEHLLFKETTRRSAVQIAQEIDAVGGELNAFTGKEHTCFYAHVVDSDIRLAIDLVTDVVFRATCQQSDVDTERQVVLEEIAMRDQDPEDLLHELFVESLYGSHELSHPILGSENSIEQLSADVLRQFHQRRYFPADMVLAVAGNVSHEDVVDIVEQLLADKLTDITAKPSAPRGGQISLPRQHNIVLHTDDTEQTHLMIGMPTLSRHDPRRHALAVMNTALGGGMSSQLFQEIREQRGLAYQVHSSVVNYADSGYMALYLGCQPHRLAEAAKVLHETLAKLATHGLTEAEVVRARGQLRGNMVLGLEDSFSRMSRLGKSELNYGNYLSIGESLALIDALTRDDIADLARTLFTTRGGVSTAAVVGPYAHRDDLPDQVHEVIAP